MTQLEEDIALILGYVRELPTKADVRDLGGTIGRDVGAVLQKLEAIEKKLDVHLAAHAPVNGQPQRPRPARVR